MVLTVFNVTDGISATFKTFRKVEPKKKLEFINTTITIGKSSDFNTDEKQ